MRVSTQIDFLDTLVEPRLQSAKRSKVERSGVHSWHSYYAGYSESFVSSAIRVLNLTNKSIVLDPWSGAGTTALVCERLGIQSIGIDINPAMNLLAAAKSGNALHLATLRLNALESLTRRALAVRPSLDSHEYLQEIMSPSLAILVSQFKKAIDTEAMPDIQLEEGLTEICSGNCQISHPLKAFLLSALFLTARRVGDLKKASNPTWFKPNVRKNGITAGRFADEYKKTVAHMVGTASQSGVMGSERLGSIQLCGDSRELPIIGNAIDAIITSPPYLTRIDYAISTRPELLILGNPKLVRAIREESMGSTVILKKDIIEDSRWGLTCLELLRKVREHNAKASESYYYKNMKQYFSDELQSLLELQRVLKPGASALVVVQSSYFKEIEISLGDIYLEMGRNIGFEASIAASEVVKGHMAHVNTRSSQYKRNKIYHEEVVHFVKPN